MSYLPRSGLPFSLVAGSLSGGHRLAEIFFSAKFQPARIHDSKAELGSFQ